MVHIHIGSLEDILNKHDPSSCPHACLSKKGDIDTAREMESLRGSTSSYKTLVESCEKLIFFIILQKKSDRKIHGEIF